jgi:hypothetical protein
LEAEKDHDALDTEREIDNFAVKQSGEAAQQTQPQQRRSGRVRCSLVRRGPRQRRGIAPHVRILPTLGSDMEKVTRG